MEDSRKKEVVDFNQDKDIIFSKSVKAGKRIYYLDVKRNRKDELFLAITESKKVVQGEGEHAQVNFEKHKIFLYREDFEKFVNGLHEALDFIKENQPEVENESRYVSEKDAMAFTDTVNDSSFDGKIKIDIDFE